MPSWWGSPTSAGVSAWRRSWRPRRGAPPPRPPPPGPPGHTSPATKPPPPWAVGGGGGGAPGRGRAPSRDALGAHCREHLAGYKAPREVHLVEEVVRSPSGKADYTWAKAAATGGETGG